MFCEDALTLEVGVESPLSMGMGSKKREITAIGSFCVEGSSTNAPKCHPLSSSGSLTLSIGKSGQSTSCRNKKVFSTAIRLNCRGSISTRMDGQCAEVFEGLKHSRSDVIVAKFLGFCVTEQRKRIEESGGKLAILSVSD